MQDREAADKRNSATLPFKQQDPEIQARISPTPHVEERTIPESSAQGFLF